jgi:hypothetical protein
MTRNRHSVGGYESRRVTLAGRLAIAVADDRLPILLWCKYELVLNLKTAKALGLTAPNLMRLLADEVIE